MSATDEYLDRLNDLLDGIPAEREGMTIGELDGYVAALIVCPEAVMPSEWLPGVWGGEGALADLVGAETIIAAVMGHYNRIGRELAEEPDAYAPVFEVDPNGGDLLWGPWINGFERAMRLRADAWEAIALGDDEDAAASVSMILAMDALDHGESEFDEEAEDELDVLAPVLIPKFVDSLNAWTKRRGSQGGDPREVGFRPVDPPSFRRKAGRNEPCPCGSGRKYKRCCGAN